jgi:hypothetical protein
MIEIGQITLSDIFLTGIGIAFGGGGALWLFRKVRSGHNILKGNEAAGSIAGGSLIRASRGGKTYTKNNNVLKGNKAGGDIAGGDIEK